MQNANFDERRLQAELSIALADELSPSIAIEIERLRSSAVFIDSMLKTAGPGGLSGASLRRVRDHAETILEGAERLIREI